MLNKIRFLPLAAALIALLLPGVAFGQSDSSIAGQVADATGGILPGVTVEAASPALIEGSRVAVTDGQGQYNIAGLRPGTYTVTFTLPGFSTMVRDGIELVVNFTANVDAELTVGSIEETITVSGQSPLVDVQRTAETQILSREVVDSLPTGRTPWSVGMTLPGVTTASRRVDVGGIGGAQQMSLVIHGSDSGDTHYEIDGMNVQSAFGAGSATALYLDDGLVDEYSFETIGGTAEQQTSGVTLNMLPKSGGNTFSGSALASYANDNFYDSTFTEETVARGLRAPSEVEQIWDYNFQFGGPIVQDRLWFFSSARFWGNDFTLPVTFDQPGVDPGPLYLYTNDLSAALLRFTGQVSPNNKLSVSYNRLRRIRPFVNTTGGPNLSKAYTTNATMRSPTLTPYIGQAKWTSTLSNKLLLEAGYSVNHMSFGTYYQDFIPDGAVKKEDLVLANQWNAGDNDRLLNTVIHYTTAKLAYVTGSHVVKGGVSQSWGRFLGQQSINQDLYQRYNAGVPVSVQVYSTPLLKSESQVDAQIGLFVQDAWTRDRLTLNGGIRYDYFRGRVPALSAGPGRFAPFRETAPVDDIPRFHNVSPRAGLAYDLTGDGKTALKVTAGRYVEQLATGFPGRYNSLGTASETRPWTDVDLTGTCGAPCLTNGDDIAQDNEIGPARDLNFGSPRSRRTFDPDLTRETNFLISATVERELAPGLSIQGGFYHREYSNFLYTDNVLTTQADYTIINVADPRGNGEIIPIFNLNRDVLGQVRNVDVNSTENKRTYNGFDASLTARFGEGGVLITGFTAGKTRLRDCEANDPNNLRFCDRSEFDIRFDTQLKLLGAYPLPGPGNFTVSFVFQSVPGREREITWRVTRAVIPTLTNSSVTVPLTKTGEEYDERHNQLDFKFAGTIQSGGVRIKPEVGLYNVLKANTIMRQINSFGPSLNNIRSISEGRLVRVGVQVEF